MKGSEVKKSISIIALLVLVSMCAAASGGYTPLFNGKTLDGWVVERDPAGFEVRDGCIHSEGGKGGFAIRTEKQYANFILRMDWMLSKTGNSGVFVRYDASAPSKIEAQLLAPWTPYRDNLHCTGSLYGYVPANPRPDETTERWRKIEIRAQYKTISVFIDEVKTSEADYEKVPALKGFALSGYIGMQDSHTGPGEWVKFRNIEVRDLDQDPLFVLKGLVSRDVEIRQTALDAAVKLGPRMAAYLLPMLPNAKPENAKVFGTVLTRIANNASAPEAADQAEIRAMLIRRLYAVGANDRRDKVLAARLLGIVGQNEAGTVNALEMAVLKGGPTGDAALDSMRVIPGKAMTDAMVRMVSWVDASKRPAVVLALGARRDTSAFLVLSQLLGIEEADTRTAAIRALGMLGSVKAVPVLGQAAKAGTKTDRISAVDALILLADDKGLTNDQQAEALRIARKFAVTDAQKTATTN